MQFIGNICNFNIFKLFFLALSDEERLLFRELVKKVDKKIAPGLFRIDWTSEFSEEYITDVSSQTAEVCVEIQCNIALKLR